MPKLNINSRNNWLSPSGLIDFNTARLNQYVLDTSDVIFNSADITTDLTVQQNGLIKGNFVINGDLTVSGDATIINTTITTIKDNIVLLNSAETGSGVAQRYSGVEIERGTVINYQNVFDESDLLFKIGAIGSLQVIATREDLPLPQGAMIYNSVLGRLDSTQTFTLPMSFTANNQSTSSSTGSILVTGGIGSTGNICSDGYISVKGNDYTNYIKSDNSNNFIINSDNDITFQMLSTKNIRIPTNVSVLLSSNATLVSNGTLLSLTNSAGDINLSTSISGAKIDLYGQAHSTLPGLLKLTAGTGANIQMYANTTLGLSVNSDGSVTLPVGTLNTQKIYINDTTDAATVSGSIITLGGVYITKSLIVNTSATVNSNLTVNGVGITPNSDDIITQKTFATSTNPVVSLTNVTNLLVSTNTRSFKALVAVTVVATSSIYQLYELIGIYNGSTWFFNIEVYGTVSTGVIFSITNAGQIQYTQTSITGHISTTMKFKLNSITV